MANTLPPNPDVMPLAPEGPGSLAYWQGQQKASLARLEHDLPEWQKQVQRYLGKVFDQTVSYDRVAVPKDYSKVERKKASLVFSLPQVTLRPRRKDLTGAVAVFQARVNDQLGIDGVNALPMLDEVAFDILCSCGFGVSKIGYEPFVDGTVPMQVGAQPAPGPAPRVPGAILGLSAPPPPMVPVIQQVPNLIFERYFWERVSPAKFLRPVTFRQSDHDKAPWLAVLFRMPKTDAIAKGWATEDTPTAPPDTHVLIPDEDLAQGPQDEVSGVEFWYRAASIDPAVKHPERFRQLVLIDGEDTPAVHRDSPFQRFDPQTGKFLSGMIGNPIHVGTTRTLADAPSPKSDTYASKDQVQELSKGRTQMISQRDRSIPLRLVDIEALGGQDKFQAILDANWQALIPVPPGTLAGGNEPIREVARAAYPREDFSFDTVINRDIDEIWGMGPNQAGLETTESKTATEQATVQRNSDARIDKERGFLLTFFAKGVGKFAALLQLFDDRQDLVEVLGPNAEQVYETWDRAKVQGPWVFEVRPDSGQRIDGEKYKKDLFDGFNFLAKDPHFNRLPLLKEMALALHLDPAQCITDQLPDKGPDQANVSFRFSGEDLDVTSPKWPIVQAMLEQSGYQLPPAIIAIAKAHAATQAALLTSAGVPAAAPPPAPPSPSVPGLVQREHPGPPTLAPKLNQHALDRTGEIPNRPAPSRVA